MTLRSPWKVLLVTSLSLLITACEKPVESQANEQKLRLVRTLEVTPPDENFWTELPGVVDAIQKADLGFRVNGKLTKLLVNEGDIVKKGQLLAQLDGTDFKIQLQSRKAEYKQMHEDYLRGQTLVKKNLISRSDYNKLEAQNTMAKANLDAAQRNLNYSYLRAPFEGRIGKRYIDNYEEVAIAQPIYNLQDISTLTVKINLPEKLVIHSQEGVERKIFASFAAIPNRQFPLTFKEIATQADETTNTYTVTLTMLPPKGFTILPGMSVTVRGEPTVTTETNKPYNAVFVPAHAVLEDDQGRYVYTVKRKEDGKTAVVERRDVLTGGLSNIGLQVNSGLLIGDEIIVAGMSKMLPGLEVRVAGGN